jgi:membrane fusion protein (multidrug efflux system)
MMSNGNAKKGHGRLIVILIIIVFVAAFAIRFAMLRRDVSVASIRSIQETEGIPVEAVPAEEGDIEVWNTMAGTVEGIVQYPVVSTNSIQVMDVLRREGDHVNKGDIIIRLEKTSPNPMLHSYTRSKALYDDALSDVRRMRVLYEEGAISAQQLEKAEMALKIAESDLVDARAGTDLVADREGVVTSVTVNPGDMANNGAPVAWVARTDTVIVKFTAGSRQAMVLEKGQRAVWFSNETGVAGEGVISRLDLSADPETRLLSGEALFPNPDQRLLPGLLVSFRVLTGERRGVVKIPVGCLMQENGGYHVYVVEEGESRKTLSRRRIVETGLRTSDEVEILSGVRPGEKVVHFGQTRLEDGSFVKVISGGEGER